MNRIFKLSTVILMSILLLAFAVPIRGEAQQPSLTIGNCDNIKTSSENIVNRLGELAAAYESNAQSEESIITEKRREQDEKILKSRSAVDVQLESDFATLLDVNERQLQTVEEYVEAVKKAVAERREGYDQAKLVYRMQTDDIKSAARLAQKQAIRQFLQNHDQAIKTALVGCTDSNFDLRKAAYLKSLREQRLEYIVSRQTIQSKEGAIDLLRSERRESVALSRAVFERAILSAKEALNP